MNGCSFLPPLPRHQHQPHQSQIVVRDRAAKCIENGLHALQPVFLVKCANFSSSGKRFHQMGEIRRGASRDQLLDVREDGRWCDVARVGNEREILPFTEEDSRHFDALLGRVSAASGRARPPILPFGRISRLRRCRRSEERPGLVFLCAVRQPVVERRDERFGADGCRMPALDHQPVTAADLLEKTYTGQIGGLQRVALRTNVSTHKAGDIVTLKVTTPSGQSFEYCRHIDLPRSNSIRVVDPKTGDLVWRDSYDVPSKDEMDRLGRLYFKFGDYTGNEKMKNDALALMNAADWETRKKAYTNLTHLPISAVVERRDVVEGSVEKEGVGGDSNVHGLTNEKYDAIESEIRREPLSDIYKDLMGLYVRPSGASVFQVGGEAQYNVRLDTPAGIIFAGFFQNCINKYNQSQQDFMRACTKIEIITGISRGELFRAVAHYNSRHFSSILHSLFTKAGYGDIFLPTSVQQLPGNSLRNISQVWLDTSKQYGDYDKIFVHFDVGMLPSDTRDTKLYDHIKVTVLNADKTTPVAMVPTVLGRSYFQSDGKLFIAIDPVDIATALGKSSLNGQYRLQISVYTGSSDTSPVLLARDGMPAMTEPFTLNVRGAKHLSVNPDKTEAALEDVILTALATQTPFDKAQGSFSVTLGSGAHDEKLHSFYAFDIGLAGSSADWGKDVLAVADGYVAALSDASMNFGTIRINHVEKGQTWQSVYLHNILEPV